MSLVRTKRAQPGKFSLYLNENSIENHISLVGNIMTKSKKASKKATTETSRGNKILALKEHTYT